MRAEILAEVSSSRKNYFQQAMDEGWDEEWHKGLDNVRKNFCKLLSRTLPPRPSRYKISWTTDTYTGGRDAQRLGYREE
jgi:hypothetical protein